jgi:hypothetical protein
VVETTTQVTTPAIAMMMPTTMAVIDANLRMSHAPYCQPRFGRRDAHHLMRPWHGFSGRTEGPASPVADDDAR